MRHVAGHQQAEEIRESHGIRGAEHERQGRKDYKCGRSRRRFQSAATQNRLKGQLNDAIEQAQSVLDNSDGMVADDSVRVALQQAIDSARNLANGTNLKENDVTAAVDALNAAKDAVQQAMDQYQEASSTPNTVTNNTNIGTNGGSNGGAANSPDNTAGGAAAGGAAGGLAGGAANAGDAGGDASAGGDAGDASDGDAAAQNLEN